MILFKYNIDLEVKPTIWEGRGVDSAITGIHLCNKNRPGRFYIRQYVYIASSKLTYICYLELNYRYILIQKIKFL